MADPAATSSNDGRAKKTKGQRRLLMKKIENKTDLLVTFCKRRVGLFNKASELCTLCGVQMALIIFSPANKLYTFAHPNVDSILDQFLAQDESDANAFLKGNRRDPNFIQNAATIEKLCAELNEVKNQVKIAEKLGEVLDKIGNANSSKSWWKKPLNEMNLSELADYKKVVEELAVNVPTYTGRASADPMSLDLAL
ncbi:hypothetical protein QQ045_032500 [Rhodiola kirilowii]